MAHKDLDHRILDTAILGLKVLALEVLANGNLARGTLGHGTSVHRDSVASEDSVASGLDRIRDRTPITEGISVVQMGLEDRREIMVSPKDVDRKVTAPAVTGLKDADLRVTRRVLDHRQMPEEPVRGKIGEEWARSEDDRAFLLTGRTCQNPRRSPVKVAVVFGVALFLSPNVHYLQKRSDGVTLHARAGCQNEDRLQIDATG